MEPSLLLMFFSQATPPAPPVFTAPTYQTPDGRALLVDQENRALLALRPR